MIGPGKANFRMPEEVDQSILDLRKREPSIKQADIARRLGASQSHVSRVLRRQGHGRRDDKRAQYTEVHRIAQLVRIYESLTPAGQIYARARVGAAVLAPLFPELEEEVRHVQAMELEAALTESLRSLPSTAATES